METNKFTKDSIIGDVIDADPKALAIIEKYFGKGCFTCPGMRMESISFGSGMHGANPEDIVRELNSLFGNGE